MPYYLPDEYTVGHELSFMLHDMLARLLAVGEEQDVFAYTVTFCSDVERVAFENLRGDVFDWMAQTGRSDVETAVLCRASLQALLADFCHFTYEALDCASKGKLTVAYALLRKPIQEVMFLFEMIAANPGQFASALKMKPLSLRATRGRRLADWVQHIGDALAVMPNGRCFDAAYLAQLRYDKSADDSFAGVTNQAMHLFTEHSSIKTEDMNINFVFLGTPRGLVGA